jgi:hypothetical protein
MSNLGGKLINTKDGLRVIWLDIWIEKTQQSGLPAYCCGFNLSLAI